jgi:hypothetical protein
MTTAKKSAAKKSSARKSPAKKTSSSNPCWPGFEPVPGKKPMTKGSCEPKPDQTRSQKKADGKAAAASKLEKAGGSKKKANKS